MSAYEAAMRRHAEQLADEQLHRVRHRLDALAPERRGAVEDIVRAVVERVADAILDEAPRSPVLAAALESIYGVAAGHATAGSRSVTTVRRSAAPRPASRTACPP